MDSHYVPLAPSQKEAFKAYFTLFEELKGLIVVVHSHAPNQYRIPGLNTRLDNKLKKRSVFFNGIMGREVPTKRIDCDPDQTGPAHMCMRRNSIREILEMAVIKPPVSREMALMRKVPAMIAVDEKLHHKYVDKLKSVRLLCQTESDRLTVDIELIECEIRKYEELIQERETDELLPIFEERFDQEMNFFNWVKDYFGRADQEYTMEFAEQEFVIDHISMVHHSIQVLNELGGQGHRSWSVRFKRDAHKSGYYHAVLSVFKRTKYRKEIEHWKWQLTRWSDALRADKAKRDVLNEIAVQNTIESPTTSRSFDLWNKAIGYRKILDFTEAKTLTLTLFLELVEAGIYQGCDTDHQAQALEKHLARKFGIE